MPDLGVDLVDKPTMAEFGSCRSKRTGHDRAYCHSLSSIYPHLNNNPCTHPRLPYSSTARHDSIARNWMGGPVHTLLDTVLCGNWCGRCSGRRRRAIGSSWHVCRPLALSGAKRSQTHCARHVRAMRVLLPELFAIRWHKPLSPQTDIFITFAFWVWKLLVMPMHAHGCTMDAHAFNHTCQVCICVTDQRASQVVAALER